MILLPAHGPSTALTTIRRTTIFAGAATGIPSGLCNILLYNTGKTAELGYLCVPIGLASGTVATFATLI